ncbi:MAG TPA: response regulator [Gemmataceae bacterium]|nr:response regulator [Gemmataceae bacterium]
MIGAPATPPTILIADDDDATQMALSFLLAQEGYRVLAVLNAKQAAERLQAEPAIDLLILDMLMGEYDGWWFMRERQTNGALAAVPVLIMTSGIVTREWALAHGAAGFVKKPLELEDLLAEVQRCLPSGGATAT